LSTAKIVYFEKNSSYDGGHAAISPLVYATEQWTLKF